MLEPMFRILLSEILSSHVAVCFWPLFFFLFFFSGDLFYPFSLFQRLSCASEGLKLSAATLKNLEILNNQVNAHPKHLHLEGRAQVCQEAHVLLTLMLLVDRRRAEGQSAVGAGPHLHQLWPQTDEEMGEPTSHGCSVSILCFVWLFLLWLRSIKKWTITMMTWCRCFSKVIKTCIQRYHLYS